MDAKFSRASEVYSNKTINHIFNFTNSVIGGVRPVIYQFTFVKFFGVPSSAVKSRHALQQFKTIWYV